MVFLDFDLLDLLILDLFSSGLVFVGGLDSGVVVVGEDGFFVSDLSKQSTSGRTKVKSQKEP